MSEFMADNTTNTYELTQETPELIVLRGYGLLSPDQVKNLVEEIKQATDKHDGTMFVLVDLTNAQSLSTPARYHVVRMMANKKLTGAIFSASVITNFMVNVSAKAARAADRIRFFRDETEARAWLAEKMPAQTEK
jgi:hypothetical protein